LKVIVSKNSGYCAGVKRAIQILDDSILKYGTANPVFTMGDIIHNPKVIENYKNKGVISISEIEKLKRNDNLIIRSHGISPEIIEKLDMKGINILNATCPFVLKVHKLAKTLSRKGYFLILIGNENHPEIIGIKGNIINENFKIINSVKEAEEINSQKKIAVISQTTQTVENFILISKKIIEKIKNEVLILNTTCRATELRQKETAILSKKVDIMVVVGGKNSANTNHIADISSNILPETYHIENADELERKWFTGKKLAGICSGASTPMEDVIKIKNIIESI
jgi:(E)-4-hydroxy-3-methyl-but-2-enyl pyrophosphate reductase